MIAQLRGRFPAGDLYSRALSAAYVYGLRILDPDFSEEREPEIWEKIRRDGKVQQAVAQRCTAVAGRNWKVEPASEEEADVALAQVIEEAFKHIADFWEARRNLANGIFRARAYAWIDGGRKRVELGKTGIRDWWIPERLRDIDKRRVQFVPEVSPQGIRRCRELWSPARQKWERVEDDLVLMELVYSDEEGRLGYGRGLLESLYLLWFAKQTVLKEGLQAIERWAQGLIDVEVDTSVAGRLSGNPDALVAQMAATIEKHRSRHVLAHDKAHKVNVHAGGGEGHQMVLDFLRYTDDAILGVAMGAVLPFGGASDEGSKARAETESDESENFLEFDRQKEDEVLTAHLVKLFMRQNQEAIRSLGLDVAGCPRFATVKGKTQNPEVNSRVAEVALRAGIALRKDEVYEKIGYSVPAEGDEVVEGTQPTPNTPGSGSPFFPSNNPFSSFLTQTQHRPPNAGQQ